MTGVLIKKRNLDTETDRHRGKMLPRDTRKEAWDRSFPHGPQKEPTVQTP